MDEETRDLLGWRNLVADWHLRQSVPLDCGCDDDTPDDAFCGPSVAYADEEFAARPDPALDGPPDPWNHDVWVAAWGRNAPLIADDRDLRLPSPPEGLSWLATRILVGGRQAIELALFRLTEHRLVALRRVRVVAEPSTVAARARRLLHEVRD